MNTWSNIAPSSGDPEIIEINQFEGTLGQISKTINEVRELITRFEVCHFKYQQHLENIKESINNLTPYIRPDQIGANHIRNGIAVLNDDKTGRSHIGQQYVDALRHWLGDPQENTDYFNDALNQKITTWLGSKSPDKIRLVRLLLARLIWDWDAYEKYQEKGEYKELEFQASRMDICHYAFPGTWIC